MYTKFVLILILFLLFSCSDTFYNYPPDLQSCWQKLDKIFTSEDLALITSEPESHMFKHHFGVGLTIRNFWIRKGDGKLYNYFKTLGITHPDDISSIILDTYWCYKNNKPIRLDERIANYTEYWDSIRSNLIPEDIFAPE